MTKSATDVMQEIIFSAILDSIGALKTASKGLPNTLLRDLNSVHANTTFADLPTELQTAINASVRAAFTRLLKEGYSISGVQIALTRNPSFKRDAANQARPKRKPPAKRDEPDAKKHSRDDGRPNRKPKPRGA